MNITIMQSSDATFYHSMLMETSRTVRQYCLTYGIRYEMFVGVKRGTMPWHSTYNRAYMLKEMLDRRVQGWVIYLDADAFIVDQDFSIRDFLADKSGLAGIFAGYCEPGKPYSVNAGGFAINLSHPVGVAIALEYWREVESIPDGQFNSSLKWGKEIEDDQGMLVRILERYYADTSLRGTLLFEESNSSHVNNGDFVRQALRSGHHNFGSRKGSIKQRVDELAATYTQYNEDLDPGFFVEASHPKLHTAVGRKDGNAIRSTGLPGTLIYGPYVDLAPGRWLIRILGQVFAREDGNGATYHSDVAADLGRRLLDVRDYVGAGPMLGTIAEHMISLDAPAIGVEARLNIDAGENIDVHAVHITSLEDWVDKDA